MQEILHKLRVIIYIFLHKLDNLDRIGIGEVMKKGTHAYPYAYMSTSKLIFCHKQKQK